MQERTVRALNAINQQFYATHAKRFADVRRSAWPGFAEIMSRVEWPTERPLRVLDLGSGSGRFAKALLKEQKRDSTRRLDYVGVDSSKEMLRVMYENLEAALEATGLRSRTRLTYLEQDLVLSDTPLSNLTETGERRHERTPSDSSGEQVRPNISVEAGLPIALQGEGLFDLVVLLGLMHHVPSHARRKRLLEQASLRVCRGGLLAASFWRFAEEPRFDKKTLGFKDYGPALGVDPADLEPGDCLLSFGVHEPSSLHGLRYCHAPSEPEVDQLMFQTGLSELARFDSDGESRALNRYRVMRRA